MGSGTATVDHVERLNRISERRLIDPDRDLPGTIGDGQLLPDELLSVHGLDVELTTEQRRLLSREEVASILDNGIRFEAVLEAGFALQVALAERVTDPRITYMLHEIGEESNHSRAFVRLIQELGPTTHNPVDRAPVTAVLHRIARAITNHETLLLVMTLAGEEIPDLLQRLAVDHPDTDPMVAALNRYHRQEEARHLSFARAVLPEAWARAGRIERAAVHHLAPQLVALLWQGFVHPGVYAAADLPTWATFRQVQRLPRRMQLRHEATRPVLTSLVDAGAVTPGAVPKAWRSLCGVDAYNVPV